MRFSLTFAGTRIPGRVNVKVMDFGLAKRLLPAEDVGSQDQTITASLTKAGVVLGTPAYMSPEQVRGQTVDTRSDIFSFGVVLYEMLTRVHPFKKAQSVETSTAILSETPLPLSHHMNEVPPVLQHIVRKMLAKDTDRRYQHIDELRIDLADLVDEIGDLRVHPEEALTEPSQVRAPVAERSWWRGVAVLMAVVAGVALWSPWQTAPTTERSVTRFAINLPEGQTFQWPFRGLGISPDGTQIAYVAEEEGDWQLYVRSLSELESQPIAGFQNPTHPVFSPDGKWLAAIDGGDKLFKTVLLSGGVPQTLCDYGKIGKGYQFSQSWTPDGDALIFGSDTGLLRVSAKGGTPEALTQVKEGEIGHAWPQILPGGQAVLFTFVLGWEAGFFGIDVLSLETGERRTLIERGTKARYVPTGHLVYAWEEKLLAAPFDLDELQLIGTPVVVAESITMLGAGNAQFSVSESGSLAYIPGGLFSGPDTLVWVDREGGEEPLAAEARSYSSPRVSPDGSRVAVSVSESGTRDVWIYDLARETPTRLTFDPALDGSPVWTVDGRRVVFVSTRDGGEGNLFWRAADGTGEVERLTTSPNYQSTNAFSPNGEWLVFAELNPETSWDLRVLSMEGERTSEPLLQTQFQEDHPAISPNGRWMAYNSDESGRYEIYVRPFPNVEDGKWQISRDGGVSPVWGPAGQELFYRSLNGEAMMRVRIQAEPTFSRRTPEVLFTGRYLRGANYDISQDGQRFLMLKPAAQTEHTYAQFIVVQNWFEELNRLVPTE